MKTSDILKTHTLVLDLKLNILVSSVKEVVGMNLYDIIQYQKIAIRDGINDLKEYQSYTVDTIISVSKEQRNSYRVVCIKGINLYYVTLILLDSINEMADTYEILETYAFTDQLTGAYNRHAYWYLLESMIYELDRQNLGLGVLLIDLDNLKEINSKEGYRGGDRAITIIAKSINDSLRKSDILVRLGGDEFLAIFRLDPKKDFTVMDMINRILNKVKRESDEKVTASIGGEYVKPGIVTALSKSKRWKEDWQEIVDKINIKLKKVKDNGKNSFVI